MTNFYYKFLHQFYYAFPVVFPSTPYIWSDPNGSFLTPFHIALDKDKLHYLILKIYIYIYQLFQYIFSIHQNHIVQTLLQSQYKNIAVQHSTIPIKQLLYCLVLVARSTMMSVSTFYSAHPVLTYCKRYLLTNTQFFVNRMVCLQCIYTYSGVWFLYKLLYKGGREHKYKAVPLKNWMWSNQDTIMVTKTLFGSFHQRSLSEQ